MSFTIGVSIAGIALMYSCSYAFNFCTWHRVVISYNASVMLLTFFIRYTSIECGYSLLLLLYYILAGVFTLIGLYLHNKKNTNTTTKDERVTQSIEKRTSTLN